MEKNTKTPIKAEIKSKYEKFVLNTKAYHESAAAFNEPADMCYQHDKRLEILGSLSELCRIFSNESRWILDAFDEYKESMRKQGVNIDFSFFTQFINCFIGLLSNTEELNIWHDEVYNYKKLLEENKVFDMSSNDIINTENQ